MLHRNKIAAAWYNLLRRKGFASMSRLQKSSTYDAEFYCIKVPRFETTQEALNSLPSILQFLRRHYPSDFANPSQRVPIHFVIWKSHVVVARFVTLKNPEAITFH